MVQAAQMIAVFMLLGLLSLATGCAGPSDKVFDPEALSRDPDCGAGSLSEQGQQSEFRNVRDTLTDTSPDIDADMGEDATDSPAQLDDVSDRQQQEDDNAVEHDESIISTCNAQDRFEAVDLGPLITYSLVGMPSDVTIADNTSYLMEDGQVRLYFWAGQMGLENTGVHSVLTTDGTSALLEDGLRIPSPFAHPKVFQLDTGQLRIFHLIPNGLGSHLSDDGLEFSQEEGMRLSSVDANLDRIGGMSVVALSEGGFRGYFSNLGVPGVPPSETVDSIKSATSLDQLAWTMDDGVRIGEEAPHLIGKGRQPFAQTRANGCITLFYQHVDSPPTQLYYATATDGLVFTQEYALIIDGWDGPAAGANIQSLADGTYRLFYDGQSDELGNRIRTATFDLAP